MSGGYSPGARQAQSESQSASRSERSGIEAPSRIAYAITSGFSNRCCRSACTFETETTGCPREPHASSLGVEAETSHHCFEYWEAAIEVTGLVGRSDRESLLPM